MKKLLVLMLVLGLTSVASATNADKMIQLSINGEPAPDEITMVVSEWIKLDIMLAPDLLMDVMELDLEIVGPGHIELDPQNVVEPTDIIVGAFESWSLVVQGVSEKGIEVIAGTSFGEVAGTLVDYILFHCDGLGDVTVTITDAGTNNILNVGDVGPEAMGSIIIHQIPEPTTVMLLGLGSLFLLRRRK
jgi:hypothetical protein